MIIELRVVIVISQRHVTDPDPPAVLVAGVSLEVVLFLVDVTWVLSFLQRRAPGSFKGIYVCHYKSSAPCSWGTAVAQWLKSVLQI
jgi:hypothetical protein